MPMEVRTTVARDASEILPRVEWKAKSGTFQKSVRSQNTAGDWETKKSDVSLFEQPDGTFVRPSMLMDFAAALNGWVRFKPYDEVMVAINGALPPKPADYRDDQGNTVMDTYGKPIRHDQVVRIKVLSRLMFGDASPLGELSMRGAVAIGAIGQLYGEYENAPEMREGKLPLVRLKGTSPIGKDMLAPVLEIVSWHPRPDALGPAPAAPASAVRGATAEQAMAAPRQAPAAHVPPPGHVPPPSVMAAASAPAPAAMPEF